MPRLQCQMLLLDAICILGVLVFEGNEKTLAGAVYWREARLIIEDSPDVNFANSPSLRRVRKETQSHFFGGPTPLLSECFHQGTENRLLTVQQPAQHG